MMKTLKRLLAGVAVAASLFSLSAPASATLTDWYLNSSGVGGVGSAVLVHDYLDLTGTAYVHNTFSSATDFTFNEVGSFLSLTADGTTLLNPMLTAKFVGTGSGTVGGALNFTPGGTLNVFSGVTDIGTFTLEAGSATLNAGTVLPNGAISFIFKANSLVAGYFFDSAGTDLSTLLASPGGLVMGFATTNVILGNTADVPGGLVTDYNSAFGTSFGTVTANSTTDLSLSNNGQFRLAVPEPSMLSLFGIALLGLGFLTRRKFKI
ncbi:MAG: PEP-CTERM sorting domain-containing protein [Burkholderiaceae bacterium]|nr:MAG: PEP-CTERM sorting domain-containing protein [Burkholderiaceae bacterium]